MQGPLSAAAGAPGDAGEGLGGGLANVALLVVHGADQRFDGPAAAAPAEDVGRGDAQLHVAVAQRRGQRVDGLLADLQQGGRGRLLNADRFGDHLREEGLDGFLAADPGQGADRRLANLRLLVAEAGHQVGHGLVVADLTEGVGRGGADVLVPVLERNDERLDGRPEHMGQGVGGALADGVLGILESVDQGADGADVLDLPQGPGGDLADTAVAVGESVDQWLDGGGAQPDHGPQGGLVEGVVLPAQRGHEGGNGGGAEGGQSLGDGLANQGALVLEHVHEGFERLGPAHLGVALDRLDALLPAGALLLAVQTPGLVPRHGGYSNQCGAGCHMWVGK